MEAKQERGEIRGKYPARRGHCRTGMRFGSVRQCSTSSRPGMPGPTPPRSFFLTNSAVSSLLSSFQSSKHHSHTLLMSYKPSSFAFFFPTGCVPIANSPSHHATSSEVSLPLYLYPRLLLPPRAAYSHCVSVGNVNLHPFGTFPMSFNFSQNAIASFHDTFSTGKSSPLKCDGTVPIAAFHCDCVTSVRPM